MTSAGTGEPDRETLLAAYFRYLLAGSDDEADAWAWDEVGDIVRRGPAGHAWEVVLALIQRAPDDQLDTVAAGPLEDLVIGHGAELVGAVEAEAARDARFQWALGCIWLQHGDLPAEAMERIVRASGGRIEPLPGDLGGDTPTT